MNETMSQFASKADLYEAKAARHERTILIERDLYEARSKRLEAEKQALLDVLERAREFINEYVDVVDGDYGEQCPNQAMQIVSAIDAIIGEAA